MRGAGRDVRYTVYRGERRALFAPTRGRRSMMFYAAILALAALAGAAIASSSLHQDSADNGGYNTLHLA